MGLQTFLIANINSSKTEQSNNSIKLIVDKLNNLENISTVAILIIGNQDSFSSFTKSFKKILKSLNNSFDILIKNDIKKVKDIEHTIILTASGTCKFEDIENLKYDIKLIDNKSGGCIHIY